MNIKFKSYDGYELAGTLLKADNEKAALVFVHGITSSKDELGFHSDYAQFLTQNGITTLRFDYRFHGRKNDGNQKLEQLSLCGIVNDIDAAFAALKSFAESTTKSFFIVGTSFGGGLSAYWVDSTNKAEIKKVILNAPVISYENDVLERNELVTNGVLSDKAQKQLRSKGFVKSSDIQFGRGLINELKYVNGINAVQNLGSRVVIFHGKEDEDVPLTSSQKYKSSQTQLEIIPKVGHGFGVEDDEDLQFPETKVIHRGIYKKALTIIESTL
ncbi:alpha/beta fold hydrolase [Flavobacterium filum]|uniref:alpha/beta hydrolase family protein n=1 Tax=Flavobacterium filum TaxID=370974 RepID=UPI0023F1A797|nr:alpha/beta fold hydrolase [Flavobacterium filum]